MNETTTANGVSFVEGESTNFGDAPLKTVSVQSSTGRMEFVIRTNILASVSGSMGSRAEIIRLTNLFIQKYNIYIISNQVHREQEARAMFSLKLRPPGRSARTNKPYTLKETIDLIRRNGSVHMTTLGKVVSHF